MCRGTQRRKARCDDFREELGRKKLSSELFDHLFAIPIGSMYGIYANIGGILMVNVTIYSIHGSYGIESDCTWVSNRLYPLKSEFPSYKSSMYRGFSMGFSMKPRFIPGFFLQNFHGYDGYDFPWDFPWEFPLFIGYQLSNLSNPDAFQAAAPGGLAETSIARCLTWQRSSWHPSS